MRQVTPNKCDTETSKYTDKANYFSHIHNDNINFENDTKTKLILDVIYDRSFADNYVRASSKKRANLFSRFKISRKRKLHTSNLTKKSVSGTYITFFKNAKNTIRNTITTLFSQIDSKPHSWVNCISCCNDFMAKYVDIELESSAYLLRCLINSINIYNTGNKSVTEVQILLTCDKLSNITGLWKSDSKHIDITIHIYNGTNNTPDYTSTTKPGASQTINNARLIMGFGPSASGKSFMTATIINLMQELDPDFPHVFASIDGGILRTVSGIYQIITCVITEMNEFAGFKNLFGDIFKFRNTKSNIKQIFMRLNNAFSLYVPLTLSGCLSFPINNCKTIIKQYVNITKDKNWIALMIWQHKHGGDTCPFIYECNGCTESGMSRERLEGKKYSNKSWLFTYNNGLKALELAPLYRFSIHNSGIRGIRGVKSILCNMSETPVRTYFKEHINTKFADTFVYCEDFRKFIKSKLNRSSKLSMSASMRRSRRSSISSVAGLQSYDEDQEELIKSI